MILKEIKNFFIDIYNKRSILFELAKRDFQQEYMGSYLGFVWVYIQPLLFITVLYMVFTFGFKSPGGTDGVPFVVYLITGMIAWFYFVANFSASANVIRQHEFLLKKVNFRLSMLPIVKLLSSFIPHMFFMIVAILIAVINDIYPTLYTLQLFYYFGAMIALLLGLGWLTSSTNIFVPDVSKIVAVIVLFGFWLTPIFWNITMIPEKFQWIIKLNPVHYIVQGYRDSIISQVGFWERPYEALYFWSVTGITMWVGITVFKKLSPHFAEVV